MRFFYIVSFILLTTLQLNSQTGRALPQEPLARVTKFYPNPAVSQITFDFDQNFDKSYSFQVFNFVGKKVLDIPAVTQKTVVNVTDFYRGVYIFQLRDKNGRMIDSGKFQVSH
ncbi:MAG TPA: T9SS type A sorting domain-containing protein [Chitinophagaceae bacterium]|nr:T9SS type A sorting domain-containing protein [Chitinophagaceae bacterium]